MNKSLNITPVNLKNNISFIFTLKPYSFSKEKLNNYKKLNKILSVNSKLARVNQIHSSKIIAANNKNIKNIHEISADGLITNIPEISLSILTADCLAVGIYDPVNNVKALAHAGWRGSLKNISVKMLQKMKSKFKTNPKNCFAFISPGIGKCCYKISDEIADKFKLHYKNTDKFLKDRILDLKTFNKLQLIKERIPRQNITINELCTSCNPKLFFSYRRDKTKDRHIAIFSSKF